MKLLSPYFARGGISAGHSTVSSHSSSSGSYSHSGSSSKTSTSTSSKSISTGKSTAKPGSTIKSGTATVKSSSAKPTSIRNGHSTGIIGDNGYAPHFYGYTPPVGSVVYYPQHSFFDYLPWIYIFSHSSPHDDHAVVVQPNGQQVQAQPQQGIDALFILNWVLFVAIAGAIIVGIVWYVNKLTGKRKETHAII